MAVPVQLPDGAALIHATHQPWGSRAWSPSAAACRTPAAWTSDRIKVKNQHARHLAAGPPVLPTATRRTTFCWQCKYSLTVATVCCRVLRRHRMASSPLGSPDMRAVARMLVAVAFAASVVGIAHPATAATNLGLTERYVYFSSSDYLRMTAWINTDTVNHRYRPYGRAIYYRNNIYDSSCLNGGYRIKADGYRNNLVNVYGQYTSFDCNITTSTPAVPCNGYAAFKSVTDTEGNSSFTNYGHSSSAVSTGC